MTEERVDRVARIINQNNWNFDMPWTGLEDHERRKFRTQAAAVIADLEAEFAARVAGAVGALTVLRAGLVVDGYKDCDELIVQAGYALAHLRGLAPAPACPRCAGTGVQDPQENDLSPKCSACDGSGEEVEG
jgi:hypothetical protein